MKALCVTDRPHFATHGAAELSSLQVTLQFFADSQENCTQELVDVVQNSVAQSLEADPLVKEVIQVVATCFNANGDLGAIANRTVARRQVSGTCDAAPMGEGWPAYCAGFLINIINYNIYIFMLLFWLCSHMPRDCLLCAYNATPYFA
jgi:hypothetical protein